MFDDELDLQPEEDLEAFHITDDDLAEWAADKIKKIEDEQDRLISIAQHKMEQLAVTMMELQNQKITKTAWLRGELVNYYLSIPNDKKSETKTQRVYKLLSGKIVEKLPAVQYERNDAGLLLWAKVSHPEFVETSEKVKWAELKKTIVHTDGDKAFNSDGEYISGVTVTMSEPTIEVKV